MANIANGLLQAMASSEQQLHVNQIINQVAQSYERLNLPLSEQQRPYISTDGPSSPRSPRSPHASHTPILSRLFNTAGGGSKRGLGSPFTFQPLNYLSTNALETLTTAGTWTALVAAAAASPDTQAIVHACVALGHVATLHHDQSSHTQSALTDAYQGVALLLRTHFEALVPSQLHCPVSFHPDAETDLKAAIDMPRQTSVDDQLHQPFCQLEGPCPVPATQRDDYDLTGHDRYQQAVRKYSSWLSHTHHMLQALHALLFVRDVWGCQATPCSATAVADAEVWDAVVVACNHLISGNAAVSFAGPATSRNRDGDACGVCVGGLQAACDGQLMGVAEMLGRLCTDLAAATQGVPEGSSLHEGLQHAVDGMMQHAWLRCLLLQEQNSPCKACLNAKPPRSCPARVHPEWLRVGTTVLGPLALACSEEVLNTAVSQLISTASSAHEKLHTTIPLVPSGAMVASPFGSPAGEAKGTHAANTLNAQRLALALHWLWRIDCSGALTDRDGAEDVNELLLSAATPMGAGTHGLDTMSLSRSSISLSGPQDGAAGTSPDATLSRASVGGIPRLVNTRRVLRTVISRTAMPGQTSSGTEEEDEHEAAEQGKLGLQAVSVGDRSEGMLGCHDVGVLAETMVGSLEEAITCLEEQGCHRLAPITTPPNTEVIIAVSCCCSEQQLLLVRACAALAAECIWEVQGGLPQAAIKLGGRSRQSFSLASEEGAAGKQKMVVLRGWPGPGGTQRINSLQSRSPSLLRGLSSRALSSGLTRVPSSSTGTSLRPPGHLFLLGTKGSTLSRQSVAPLSSLSRRSYAINPLAPLNQLNRFGSEPALPAQRSNSAASVSGAVYAAFANPNESNRRLSTGDKFSGGLDSRVGSVLGASPGCDAPLSLASISSHRAPSSSLSNPSVGRISLNTPPPYRTPAATIKFLMSMLPMLGSAMAGLTPARRVCDQLLILGEEAAATERYLQSTDEPSKDLVNHLDQLKQLLTATGMEMAGLLSSARKISEEMAAFRVNASEPGQGMDAAAYGGGNHKMATHSMMLQAAGRAAALMQVFTGLEPEGNDAEDVCHSALDSLVQSKALLELAYVANAPEWIHDELFQQHLGWDGFLGQAYKACGDDGKAALVQERMRWERAQSGAGVNSNPQ